MSTSVEWFEKVRQHEDVLERLVADYHPAAMMPRPSTPLLPITAPSAERARQEVANLVKGESNVSPRDRFRSALRHEDVESMYTVLNQTWFGVPESTGCWDLEGFSELVELLEDPPEEEEEVCDAVSHSD